MSFNWSSDSLWVLWTVATEMRQDVNAYIPRYPEVPQVSRAHEKKSVCIWVKRACDRDKLLWNFVINGATVTYNTTVLSNEDGVHVCVYMWLSANGQWNPWGPWSGCSKSCDGGWQRRVRVCQGQAVTGQQCEGNGEEVHKCSEQRCPGNCMDNKHQELVPHEHGEV